VVDPADSPLSDGVGYEITKQVNLGQLVDEIEKATDTSPVNLATTASDDDPGATVLWMTPAGLDAAVIAQVVADHVPDPLWGVSSTTQEFNAALSRLRENPDGELSNDDLVALVKGIALNFTAFMPPPPSG
jgi:hypothetical protein